MGCFDGLDTQIRIQNSSAGDVVACFGGAQLSHSFFRYFQTSTLKHFEFLATETKTLNVSKNSKKEN